MLSLGDTLKKGGKPFRFFNYLEDHPNFDSIVQGVWRSSFTGSMSGIWHTVKVVKSKLKDLHSTEFQGVRQKIDLWREELDKCQLGCKVLIWILFYLARKRIASVNLNTGCK